MLESGRSNVARTLSLLNLAPDIITAIMTGKAPETLALTKLIYGFPESWQEQREAAETEFPVPRHVMLVTTPEDRELELQRMVCERFCRYEGNEGIEKAMEELRFVEENWNDNVFIGISNF